MPTTKMLAKCYRTFGRCIYCLERFEAADLTDEHIIPLALSGSLIIRKAACEQCRDRTSTSFENAALQADFLIPRLLLELKRRKKATPKRLPLANVKLDDGRELLSIELELSQYPTIVQFQVFQHAGHLVGVERSGSLDRMKFSFINLPLPRTFAYQSFETRHKIDFTAFALTLAKIAYCYAIAERGISGFDGSEMRSLLLGHRSDTFNFVGGPLEVATPKINQLHWLSFRQRGAWLTVVVHLFASFGVSPYEVAVGRTLPRAT